MSTVIGTLRTRLDSAAGSPSSRLLGPQAVRDLAQLGDGGAELGDARVEQLVDVDGAVVEVALGQPQLHAERDEPLLGAVVQVAFHSAALLVADLDQPGPARLGLAQGLATSVRSRTTSTRVLQRSATSRSSSGEAGPAPRTRTPVCSSSSRTGTPSPAGTGSPARRGRRPSPAPGSRPGGRVPQRLAERGLELLGPGPAGADLAVQVVDGGQCGPAQRVHPGVD